ncbi:MAG: hypothetical protein F7C07_02710 [Desulfurococcales archaeon]|nr:hypothetical protein [Desulfurococcales archaeon]
MAGVNRQDLKRYDLEAWIHMTFYKAAVYYSIYMALLILGHLAGLIPWVSVKYSLAIFWALLTPSMYSVVKGMLMVYTKGVVFGHIGEGVRERLAKRYSGRVAAARIAFIAVMAAWVVGLVAFIAWG